MGGREGPRKPPRREETSEKFQEGWSPALGRLGRSRVLSSQPDIKLECVEVKEGRAEHWDYKGAVVPGRHRLVCLHPAASSLPSPEFCCLLPIGSPPTPSPRLWSDDMDIYIFFPSLFSSVKWDGSMPLQPPSYRFRGRVRGDNHQRFSEFPAGVSASRPLLPSLLALLIL